MEFDTKSVHSGPGLLHSVFLVSLMEFSQSWPGPLDL